MLNSLTMKVLNANQETVTLHGEVVVPNSIAVSNFVCESHEKSPRFLGTLEELSELVVENWDNWEPGTGSVDGDVRLVKLPTDLFVTDVVEITEENKHLLKASFEPRREGEFPVASLYFDGGDLEKAGAVRVVVYRADVLAQDNDRTSVAEWEVIAVLTDPKTGPAPMETTTMARNKFHHPGGTFREYTSEEWANASLYWQRHARIK